MTTARKHEQQKTSAGRHNDCRVVRALQPLQLEGPLVERALTVALRRAATSAQMKVRRQEFAAEKTAKAVQPQQQQMKERDLLERIAVAVQTKLRVVMIVQMKEACVEEIRKRSSSCCCHIPFWPV